MQIYRLLEREKSDDLALSFKETGNRFYQKNDHDNAILFYAKCLCEAAPLSLLYYIALANRSAALFKQGKHADALQDIWLCLEKHAALPVPLLTKLAYRRIQLLQSI